MKPFTDLPDAVEAIKTHDKKPEDFLLPISDDMNDSSGVAMAILTNVILSRGWIPNGYEQRDGYRVYTYRSKE
jgi:hypothetical protein